MKQSFSISMWHQMAMEGTAPPVRIVLMGSSMFPLVRYNKDHVTIVPCGGDLKIGDIVLFINQNRNLHVVHRIWDIKDNMVLTWGDNCAYPDGWIPSELILGKVVLIERGKRRIVPNSNRGVQWARFWHLAGKGFRWCMAIKRRIVKLIQNRKREKVMEKETYQAGDVSNCDE